MHHCRSMDTLDKLTVPKLRKLLKERGISSSGYNKARLIELARHGLKLYEPFEEDDKESSLKKRTCVEGGQLSLPDSSSVKYTHDLSDLPPISMTDLLIYLRITCKWTDERLRRYKDDDGFKLHKDCHVLKVRLGKFPDKEYTYVRGDCVREQQQGAEPYQVWILLRSKSAEVMSAGCTCVAADDGTCKHVVALLFGSIDFSERHVDRHTKVGTDIRCEWRHSRKESKPVPVNELDFRKSMDTPLVEPSCLHYVPLKSHDIQDADNMNNTLFLLLKEHAPNAVALKVMEPPPNFLEIPEKRPPYICDIIKSLRDDSCPVNMETFTEALKRVPEILTDEIGKIPQGTQNWLKHRHARITGSVMGAAWGFKMTNKPNNYLVRLILGITTVNPELPSIKYGREFEAVARTLYCNLKEREGHKKLLMKETGLLIDKQAPYLGASPDGIVSCTCCGQYVLEIKCSYTYRHKHPTEIAEGGKYEVYINDDGKMCLKKTSKWYHQMQAEMAITGCQFGELVLFTDRGISTARVEFSEAHWAELKNKCRDIYSKFVLPQL